MSDISSKQVGTTRMFSILAPLLGLTFIVSGCATDAAAQTSVDPLTCYIDDDGPSIAPEAVTLRCGGGMESAIDLTDARPETEPGTSLGEWSIVRASVGTSDIGSAIVRVSTEHAGESCTYYRNLAENPETTSTDCKGRAS